MHLDVYREYCLSKPGAWEDLPFGPDILVFKVLNKMFSAMGLDRLPPEVSLKCDPERVPELREAYQGIHTGPYMNKKHWNFIELQSDVPAKLIRELVDHSYALVVAGMKKADRERLAALSG